MRRIASHYIYWRQFYRLHYVELNDNGVLAGIFPLEGEIAGTEFYDGILILVPIPALDAGAQENKRCHQDSYSDTSFVIPSQVREFDYLDLVILRCSDVFRRLCRTRGNAIFSWSRCRLARTRY